MFVVPVPIYTVSRAVQFLNAPSPNPVSPVGSITLVRFVLPANSSFSIFVTFDPERSIVVAPSAHPRPLQLETVLGIVMVPVIACMSEIFNVDIVFEADSVRYKCLTKHSQALNSSRLPKSPPELWKMT